MDLAGLPSHMSSAAVRMYSVHRKESLMGVPDYDPLTPNFDASTLRGSPLAAILKEGEEGK